MKMNGPYIHTTGRLRGRQYVNITNNGKKTSMLYSRYLILQERDLAVNETVDHINEDFSDDSRENLQVLSNVDNIKKHIDLKRPLQMFVFNCPVCGIETSKPLHKVKHNRKQGKSGPYCSKACASKRV